ncbi:hypothetical protein ANN_11438 [Periplaneta americana]|uniref:Uncharacterized protein n=1 Tax=Periplaneta americana TaxID=6978 RepID=A0ABQ8T512_PERAM|nr:hypothetical protein ANN_11438 [Periplaneta americana]
MAGLCEGGNEPPGSLKASKRSQPKLSTKSSYLLAWSSNSPDLTPPDFFVWGFVKDIVYSQKPRNIDDLRVKITQLFNKSPLLCYNGHGLNCITVMSCKKEQEVEDENDEENEKVEEKMDKTKRTKATNSTSDERQGTGVNCGILRN